ncbi:MAG: xylulokinase [Chloroflexi bacterium]|nr:xylulokinase [Chloroflexota bacterium]
MVSLILAHDLGTTGNKASLFDSSGRLIASALASYETRYPHPGWAEQNPQHWWQAVIDSTRRMLAESGRSADEIAVVGFSGQMMGCLPVNMNGTPLYNAVIWADQRAAAEAHEIAERIGTDSLYRITGHRPSANYTAAKLLWLKRHEPSVFSSAQHILQAKDYIAWRLTGSYATDCSDASGTNLYDLTARAWSDEILDKLGIDRALLPAPVPSASIIGEVTSSAADATGLKAGTPVVIGGGDGGCATVGAGVVRPGDAYNYIGSSSWLAYITEQPLYDPLQRTFTFAHLDPRYFFPTGTMQAAGGSFDWLERLLRGSQESRLYRDLDRLAETVEPGAGGLLFLPYLIGERSPYWSTSARAAFVGLTMTHGRAEMTRAVLEGVAFNLRLILDAFREQGAVFPSLRIIGGGARSALWRQIMADILEVPLQRPRLLAEATSLGAAVAAGVGVGLFKGYEAASELVPLEPGEQPDPTTYPRYRELYALFARAYHALEPIYTALAEFAPVAG